MTREEYLAEVDRISFGVLDVLGPDLSAYISEKVMALDEYDDIVDGYIEKSREIEDRLVTDE